MSEVTNTHRTHVRGRYAECACGWSTIAGDWHAAVNAATKHETEMRERGR